MMNRFYPFIITLPLLFLTILKPSLSNADFWGGDLPLLAQILSNSIQQLSTLQQTLNIAKGDADLIQKVNRDITNALSEIYAIQDVVRDTTSIGRVKDPVELLNRVRGIYGRIPNLGNIEKYEFVDNVAANSFGVDNDSHVHAARIDQAALNLQQLAKTASPGKAQQLTAQTNAIALHSLAQIERTNATLVRIQATQLALANEHQKALIVSFQEGYGAMNGDNQNATDLSLGGLN